MKFDNDTVRAGPLGARLGRGLVVMALLACGLSLSRGEGPVPGSGPAKVAVRQDGGRFRLYVNDKPFYIKGAGIEFGSPEKLKEHGGNSFRTWSTINGRDSGRAVLDRALTNGLFVAMGLNVSHERHGFDYDDTNRVARQFATLMAEVREYKDHPALLMWIIGNELNTEKNPKVWDAVDALSKEIHRIDPNHPTTTTLAGFPKAVVEVVGSRAPDLDFLSFQIYSDIINLPRYLKDAAWDRPYVVTEWGATGHWECGRTAWGAPLENDSTAKAELYRMRFEKVIQSDQRLCLGSYVFFWGQKQERTPTWYGMFLKSGEETPPVDVVHYLWTGSWPANRSPKLEGLWLDEKRAIQNVHLKPGQSYAAKVQASDPDRDPLSYSWEVMEESTERKFGGDVESIPKKVTVVINHADKSEITFKAPSKPGPYRLFAYVFDGQGHAAHANIPFYVDLPSEAPQAALPSAAKSQVPN
jgi:hypothetical protein